MQIKACGSDITFEVWKSDSLFVKLKRNVEPMSINHVQVTAKKKKKNYMVIFGAIYVDEYSNVPE